VFLGLLDSLGTIEQGKIADLVVLDADPLAEFRNTTKLHAVLVRDRLLSPEDRTRILAGVEVAAAGQS
jgi:imidazolonepropionase-like amidohydrolase